MSSDRARRALVYLDNGLDDLPDTTLSPERREQLQDEAAKRKQRRRGQAVDDAKAHTQHVVDTRKE